MPFHAIMRMSSVYSLRYDLKLFASGFPLSGPLCSRHFKVVVLVFDSFSYLKSGKLMRLKEVDYQLPCESVLRPIFVIKTLSFNFSIIEFIFVIKPLKNYV